MEKLVHYCWFGGKPLTKLTKKCIKSWKKYLPGYKIIEWNEKNFDIHINKFCEDAYVNQKWAFVADIARCYVLKEFGGVYFDTDMLVTKNIDDLLEHDFIVGWESSFYVAAGVMYAKNPHNEIVESLWEYYEKIDFDINNVHKFAIPILLTTILVDKFNMKQDSRVTQKLENGACIYPREYFYPIPSGGDNSGESFTDKTSMIHYYIGSWLPKDMRLRAEFRYRFGDVWGKRLLDALVFGKKVIRKTGKLIIYPYVIYKNKRRS